MKPQSRECLKALKPYVAGKSIEEIRESYGLDKIVKLASNENPIGVPKRSQEVLKNQLDRVFQYPQGHSPELTQTLCEKYSIREDQVVFSNGSDEMVQMLANTFLDQGDVALSSENTFSEYKFSTLVCGGVYQAVPMKAWKYDLDAILQSIQSHTKLIFICNPNNPTGTWHDHQTLLSFLDEVPSHIIVVVDEAYAEYAEALQFPQLIPELIKRENLILLRTFSKLYGLAGLRVGYALSNPRIVNEIKRVKQPFNVNLLAQLAAKESLLDQDHIDRSLEVNRSGLQLICQLLDELNWEYMETQGNFITFKVGDHAVDYVKSLESQGLIMRSLASFGLDQWVRLTVGTPEELSFWQLLTRKYYDSSKI